MGLGILDDKSMEHVPGTTQYFDDPERPLFATDGAAGMKCDTSGPVPIILVPQPSDDPNDPLNWPLWRRDLITFVLSMVAIFATALGPILAANTVTLSLWFTVTFTNVALLTGYFLLGVGAAGIFFVPSSRIWGKRHAFVLGVLILIASSAWGGAVGKNYNSMVGARVVQGIGCAPYEALVNAAVGDLYFVHQRGKRMAFTNLAVFGGAFFTPILVGKITHTIMWWWTFYLVAIFCAACLPLVVLFCPETAYSRDQSLNTDMLATDEHALGRSRGAAAASSVEAGTGAGGSPTPTGAHPDRPSQQLSTSMDESTSNEVPPASALTDPASRTANGDVGAHSPDEKARMAAAHTIPRKKTFRQSIALFDGRKTDEPFHKLFLRPIVLFLQPAFLWAALIQGTMIGWTVFIGVILGMFFMGHPLWWDEVETGYAYTGAFIGALIGFLVAGGLSDWSARRLTRLNGGVYEPEFRILLVIPQLVLGCAGLYGFGITADGMKKDLYHWSVPIAFFGLEVAGMVIGAVASSLYLVDAYRDLAIEGFTCMIIFKNFFSYGLTYSAYDWILQNKTLAAPVFNALGTVQLVVCLLSIPMYIFGKKIRGYFYRHDLLETFKLR